VLKNVFAVDDAVAWRGVVCLLAMLGVNHPLQDHVPMLDGVAFLAFPGFKAWLALPAVAVYSH
jgi:hypothetical protein